MFNPSRSSRLLLLLVSLVSLLAAGCGDSREDYVFTGAAPNPASTGSLTFRFQRPSAQQAGVAPAGTTSLLFEFFESAESDHDDLVHTAATVYSDSVTVQNVPVSASYARITAYGSGSHPLALFTASFRVVPGSSTPVDLTAPTPITFDRLGVTPAPLALSLASGGLNSDQLVLSGLYSNGQSVGFAPGSYVASATFESSDDSVVVVSDSGRVSAVGNGSANITATYTVNGVTRGGVSTVTVTGAPVDTLTITPGTLSVPQGQESEALQATFTPVAGSAQNVTSSGFLSFMLETPLSGISVDNLTGVVIVDLSTPINTTANVVATYDDGAGNSASADVPVLVTLRDVPPPP